ncbi:sodium:solute symporter [Cyclobacterium sediminis]
MNFPFKNFSLLGLICFISIAFTSCGEKSNRLMAEDKTLAYEVLDKVMHEEEQWVKVHAAEYKLQVGDPEGVYETFLEQLDKFGELPPYRIGIWRVLAKSAPTKQERQQYIDNILAVYNDPQATDRIHAAETLAKLGVPVSTLAKATTEEILKGEKGSLWVYTLWASLQGEENDNNPLFEALISGIPEEIPRLQAAYALKMEGKIPEESWKKLASLALDEPDNSIAKVHLLTAAYYWAGTENQNSAAYKAIETQILELQHSEKKGDRMALALAISHKGDWEHQPLLLGMLRNDAPIKNEVNEQDAASNADVMATAAFALLHMEQTTHQLSTFDWVIVLVYMLGMMLIGYIFSKKNKNEKDFLLGGGKMNPVAVGLSLFATLLSSLSYLSYPGEMIKYGPVIFSGVLAFPLIYYIVGWFLIPRFMKLKVTSAYEILEINLGVSIRLLATFLFLSLRFLWMGTIIFITVNTAIISIFGFEDSTSNILWISIILIGVTIIYTTMGGLKAVVFTDVIQSCVLLGGAFLTLVLISIYFGSATSWIPTHWLDHWGEYKWGIDARERLSIGNALLMTVIWYVASSGSDQMSIQRFLATENIQTARKTFAVSLITSFVAQFLLGLVGLAVLAYFLDNPQFLAAGESVATDADILFPKFILVGLPIGISGLVAAGILAAAMSSLSSGLSATSSVISEDLFKRFSRKAKPKKVNQLKRIRILSLFVGIFTLALSLLISRVEGNLYDVIVKVVNLFVSPLFVLFFMALFIPFATARGVLIGGLISIAVAIAVAFFKFMGIEVLFITPASLFSGIVAGIVFSYIDHKFLGNQETMQKRSEKIIDQSK